MVASIALGCGGKSYSRVRGPLAAGTPRSRDPLYCCHCKFFHADHRFLPLQRKLQHRRGCRRRAALSLRRRKRDRPGRVPRRIGRWANGMQDRRRCTWLPLAAVNNGGRGKHDILPVILIQYRLNASLRAFSCPHCATIYAASQQSRAGDTPATFNRLCAAPVHE